jgi:hypothetical protein
MTTAKCDFPQDLIERYVLSKESLGKDEVILACDGHGIFRKWTRGVIITNEALLTWNKKEVKRYRYSEMEGMDLTHTDKPWALISFNHDGRPEQIQVRTLPGIHNVFLGALPSGMEPASIIKLRMLEEFQKSETGWEPITIYSLNFFEMDRRDREKLRGVLTGEERIIFDRAKPFERLGSARGSFSTHI